jgi:hypothetical protein
MTADHRPMDRRSSRSWRQRLPLLLIVSVAVVLGVVGIVSAVRVGGIIGLDLVASGAMLGSSLLGALILDRRPGEPVGRVCVGIGAAISVAAILRLAAVTLDALLVPPPPIAAALAVVAGALASTVILVSGPLLVSRFPRRASNAWQRRAEDAVIIVLATLVLSTVFRPGLLDYDSIDLVLNPLGLDWYPSDPGPGTNLAIAVYVAATLLTSAGLALRYRTGDSIVRAQVRWFAASIAVSLSLLGCVVITTGQESLGNLAWAAWILSLGLPPIAIAMAILRYHLYDIDRIVSNTIGYGLVTVILFGVFATANILLVSSVSPLVKDETIAVAASTLLVAVLFDPLRKRVQAAVDRRFHRAHYDAQRTVAEFAGRLRNELDLPTLTLELAAVADSAVKPTTTSLWLRGGRRP